MVKVANTPNTRYSIRPMVYARTSAWRGGQPLADHLTAVGERARFVGAKFGLPTTAHLLGLVHDLGKALACWQAYLQTRKPGDPKLDHATLGAYYLWTRLSRHPLCPPDGFEPDRLIAALLGTVVISHHGQGLYDLARLADGAVSFPLQQHFEDLGGQAVLDAQLVEARHALPESYWRALEDLSMGAVAAELRTGVAALRRPRYLAGKPTTPHVFGVQVGLLLRMLYSALIDADRRDAAYFAQPAQEDDRQDGDYTAWATLITRLEDHLGRLTAKGEAATGKSLQVNAVRARVSAECRQAGRQRPAGALLRLTVPTGGGKTLASLRFALHHAAAHNLDRVIFVIPYTTIIEQNAGQVREVLGDPPAPGEKAEPDSSIVLEHHASILPEQAPANHDLLAEDWDAPVVYTTSVQFLNTLFSSQSSSARRMHQLARAVIVVDEAQSLPFECLALFNSATHYLTEHCGSTLVLCTATQPELAVLEPTYGSLTLPPEAEIMQDVPALFRDLARTTVSRKYLSTHNQALSYGEAAAAVLAEAGSYGSALLVVNTKKQARQCYQQVHALAPAGTWVVHLSTNMVAAQRRQLIAQMNAALKAKAPVICISTNLIEAGVDVDFGCAFRCLAGLDNLAQTAGRANRNGYQDTAPVFVVRLTDEPTPRKTDITDRNHAASAKRTLTDLLPAAGDLLGPEAMQRYFKTYYESLRAYQAYPLSSRQYDTIVDLLGTNELVTQRVADWLDAGEDHRLYALGAPGHTCMLQSFHAASQAFKVIDEDTITVLVPWDAAAVGHLDALRNLRTLPTSAAEARAQRQVARHLLRRLQPYTLALRQGAFDELRAAGALESFRVHDELDFFVLAREAYDDGVGVVVEV